MAKEDKEFREKLDICTRMYFFMYVNMERKVSLHRSHLYSMLIPQLQRETEEREFQRVREQANKKWTSENSRRIFEKLHLRRLKDLFDLIDSDKDGEISENSFQRADLPKEALAVLRPLMKSGKKLGFTEFLEQLQ